MTAALFKPLVRVEPGAAVRAADHNALVEAVTALARRAGDPRQLGWAEVLEAVIVAVNPVGPPAPTPAGNVTYDLQPVGLSSAAKMTGVKPDWGRPVEPESTTKIIPAAVGDRALVIRYPDANGTRTTRVFIQERIRFSACGA